MDEPFLANFSPFYSPDLKQTSASDSITASLFPIHSAPPDSISSDLFKHLFLRFFLTSSV